MKFSNSALDAIKEKMPFQSFTRIVGEPDFSSLHNLYKEVKANAASVHSTLGGGQHGHLGLVVPATTYAHLSNTPWVDPLHPGPDLNIPAGTAQHQANHLRDVYARDLSRFQTAHTVTAIITRQINQWQHEFLHWVKQDKLHQNRHRVSCRLHKNEFLHLDV